MARLLNCPKENLVTEVNQFFTNTWDRHGNGIRPDAPGTDPLHFNLSTTNNQTNIDIQKSISSGIKSTESPGGGSEFEDRGSSDQHSDHQLESQNSCTNSNSSSKSPVHSDKVKNFKPNHLVNNIQRSPFARTRSSPELTDTYKDGTWRNRAPESGKNPTSSDTHSGPNSYHRNRRKNIESEQTNVSSRSPVDNSLNGINTSQHNLGLCSMSKEILSMGAQGMHQDEQDLVNMMASPAFHGFNGHPHMPMNLAPGHLPSPISPSFLASMDYSQRNLAEMIPTNIPLMDPLFTGMPFSHGFVSPQLSQYFSTMRAMLNSDDLLDPSNENPSSAGMNSEILSDVSSSGGFAPDRVNSEILQSDEKPQSSSSTGLNYISPPRRVGGCGGFVRNQQKHDKEKRGSSKNEHLDHFQHDDRVNDVYDDERLMSSRFSSAAHSNSLRSKTLSESSSDETPTSSKSNKEKRGKKAVALAESSTGNAKGKATSERLSVEDDLDFSPHVAEMNGCDSTMSIPSMIFGPNSRHGTADNSGVLPLTFYPTGPPVPFLTMLPFYNSQSDDVSTSHFGGEESLDNGNYSPERLDPSEDFSSSAALRGATPGETPDECNSDILNSDFASHWQNLQFGRFCQTPTHHGPMVYPSSVMVPPAYLQGRVPWDGPGRPISNMNILTQLMNYGPRLVPFASVQPASSRPPNIYQRYIDDLPRYRSGTGTYLPNPKVSVRERPRKGNYNYGRSENHVDREANCNVSSKSRSSSRNHNRSHADKSSSRLDRLAARDSQATDRVMDLYRHHLFPTYQPQNVPLHPSSSQSGPANVTYGMYSSLPSSIPSSLSSNGPTVPSVVMVYPYEQNAGFGSHTDQFEFGPLGPTGTLEEPRFYGSSPEQPSSPHYQRRV